MEDNDLTVTSSPINLAAIWPWIICALGAMFYCYEYYLRISPSVMSQSLMSTYHLDAARFGNLTADYYYAYVPLQFVVGLLVDRYGPRRLLILACLTCAMGAYLFAASDLLWVAQAGRFFIGFGSAFAFVCALKLATIWLPANRFAFVSGFITALGMVGAIAGDMTLTKMVVVYGWRETMVIAAILGVVLTLVILLFLKKKRTTGQAAIEDEHSLHDLLQGLGRALMKKQMWIIGGIGTFLYLSLSAFAELWSIPYFEVAHHLGKMQAASLNTAIFLGWAIGGPLVGLISDKIKQRRLFVTFGAFFAFVFISIILYLPIQSFVLCYVLMFLFGFATSSQVLVFPLGKETNSDKMAGTSLALVNAFVMMGGLIFQPVIGWVLDYTWHGSFLNGARYFSTTDYRLAMSVIPVCMIFAFILSLFLRETGSKLKKIKNMSDSPLKQA
jgi:MFS family permease